MKKYFLFDDEQISGKTYVLRLFVSCLLLVFLVGIWLVASTAYKRARSLGWDEGFSNIIAFGILIHLSVGAWPDSVFESGSIFIITIPLYILQLYMVFKNAKPVKSSATGEKAGRIIGEYLYTPIKWKNILIYVGLGLLLKVLLHFSLFPEKSIELDTNNKVYVDGYSIDGWYYKARDGAGSHYDLNSNGLYKHKCYVGGEMYLKLDKDIFRREKATEMVEDITDCTTLYRAARYGDDYGPRFWQTPYTKNGERYRLEKNSNLDSYGNPTTVYYYPYKNLGFISHFGLIFKSKLWLFLISVGLTIFLTFIFRHKFSIAKS